MSITNQYLNVVDVPPTEYVMHGVNCVGVMGAGIALAIARAWPSERDAYVDMVWEATTNTDLMAEDLLGMIFVDPKRVADSGVATFDFTRPTVIHACTQVLPGPNADLHAVVTTFKLALEFIKKRDHDSKPKLFMPRVGCGIGGLKWNEVFPHLEEAYQEHSDAVDVIVIDLPPR